MARDKKLALSFGSEAAAYERGRPGYPLDAVEWLLSRAATDDGALPDVVDVGAGTGKFTAALVGRAASITAVEPDAQMRALLAANLFDAAVVGAADADPVREVSADAVTDTGTGTGTGTDVDAVTDVDAAAGADGAAGGAVVAVEGTAERIPLGDDSADVVTVAQAWHWVDVDAASREVARILRPGGVLALVWNIRDASVDWVARLGEIMGSSEAERYDSVTPPIGEPLSRDAHAEFHWTNTLDHDELRAMITSRSYVIAMTEPDRADLLARVDDLLRTHPDLAGREQFDLPYITRVTIAREF